MGEPKLQSFPVRALSAVLVSITFVGWTGLFGATEALSSEKIPHHQVKAMTKIRITVEGNEIAATLDENATTRDFLSLLPMTLKLEDYNQTEKFGDLPGRLSTKGAPDGIDPSPGDITYYAPWGNLALFYQDFGYSRGLVLLGRIASGVEVLRQSGPLKATIERAD